MKTDAYTKIILTVIACALLGILFKDSPSVVSSAHASSANGVTDVNIVSINNRPVSGKDSNPLPVNIIAVGNRQVPDKAYGRLPVSNEQ